MIVILACFMVSSSRARLDAVACNHKCVMIPFIYLFMLYSSLLESCDFYLSAAICLLVSLSLSVRLPDLSFIVYHPSHIQHVLFTSLTRPFVSSVDQSVCPCACYLLIHLSLFPIHVFCIMQSVISLPSLSDSFSFLLFPFLVIFLLLTRTLCLFVCFFLFPQCFLGVLFLSPHAL